MHVSFVRTIYMRKLMVGERQFRFRIIFVFVFLHSRYWHVRLAPPQPPHIDHSLRLTLFSAVQWNRTYSRFDSSFFCFLSYLSFSIKHSERQWRSCTRWTACVYVNAEKYAFRIHNCHYDVRSSTAEREREKTAATREKKIPKKCTLRAVQRRRQCVTEIRMRLRSIPFDLLVSRRRFAFSFN